jgi:hypothetical protein
MNDPVRIPLTQGKFALIDAADLPMVEGRRWQLHVTGTGGVYAASRGVKMHRLLMAAPDGVLVDHRNGDGLDNRRSNLRLTDHSGNQRNRHRPNCTSRTGVLGVGQMSNGRYRVQLRLDGKTKHFGTFTDLDAARAVAIAARAEHYSITEAAR